MSMPSMSMLILYYPTTSQPEIQTHLNRNPHSPTLAYFNSPTRAPLISPTFRVQSTYPLMH